MLADVIGGIVSGWLALPADAGHMATDFAAASMAWLAYQPVAGRLRPVAQQAAMRSLIQRAKS